MPIQLSFIPLKRTYNKYPTTVQLCPKYPLGMPMFKQNKNKWKHESSNLIYLSIGCRVPYMYNKISQAHAIKL